MSKHQILLVDDEALYGDLIKNALEESCDINQVESGEECLEYLKEAQPDLILLDVSMPGIDGYETCTRLKSNPETSGIPIIFVSGHDKLEEHLKGYEVGGQDYITKPFAVEVLRQKVEVNLSVSQEKMGLKQSADEAMQTAMSVMTSTGEMSSMINLLREILNYDDFDSLITRTFNGTKEFGLKCAIQIRLSDRDITQNDTGTALPLERTLLNELKTEGSIFDFGPRTVYNYGNTSLLVKNMPLDDPEAYGRHKDNLALLVEGINSKVESLEAHEQLEKQQLILKKAIDSAKDAMHKTEDELHHFRLKTAEAIENLVDGMNDSFVALELSEHQENTLLDMVTVAFNSIMSLQGESLKAEEYLESVVQILTSAMIHNKKQKPKKKPVEISESSIDLF